MRIILILICLVFLSLGIGIATIENEKVVYGLIIITFILWSILLYYIGMIRAFIKIEKEKELYGDEDSE